MQSYVRTAFEALNSVSDAIIFEADCDANANVQYLRKLELMTIEGVWGSPEVGGLVMNTLGPLTAARKLQSKP